jgi:hypothetical protein
MRKILVLIFFVLIAYVVVVWITTFYGKPVGDRPPIFMYMLQDIKQKFNATKYTISNLPEEIIASIENQEAVQIRFMADTVKVLDMHFAGYGEYPSTLYAVEHVLYRKPRGMSLEYERVQKEEYILSLYNEEGNLLKKIHHGK